VNTPAPQPSKAHMQSLIDTTIRPNPYEPVVGDIYGREPSARVDGLPLRVVVLALGEDDLDGDLSIMEDGREETLSNLPAYLASIHGIEPIGRVRSEAPPPEVARPAPSPDEAQAATDERLDALRESQREYPEDIVSRLLREADTAPNSEAPLLVDAATTIDNLRNGRGG